MRKTIIVCLVGLCLSACNALAAPTPTPTLTPSPLPSPTLVPTNTATPLPSATVPPTEALPTAVPTATVVLLDPLLDIAIPPPIEITLPEGWQFGYDTLLYRDVDGQTDSVPFALYSGPVTDGTGTIVLVWGFDSVTGILPNEFGERNIFLDAIRILRTVIFDPRCNIGTAPQRDYTIGNLLATGTPINITSCPEGQPDTRGWLASTVRENVNFAFYVYIDPLPPLNHPSEAELQAILDTVVFRIGDMLITPAELAATQQALQLTPVGD